MNNFIITLATSCPIWNYFFSNSSKLKIFPLKSNRIVILIYIWQELATMKIFVFIYLSILQVFYPFRVNSCSGGESIKTRSEYEVTRKIFYVLYKTDILITKVCCELIFCEFFLQFFSCLG